MQIIWGKFIAVGVLAGLVSYGLGYDSQTTAIAVATTEVVYFVLSALVTIVQMRKETEAANKRFEEALKRIRF